MEVITLPFSSTPTRQSFVGFFCRRALAPAPDCSLDIGSPLPPCASSARRRRYLSAVVLGISKHVSLRYLPTVPALHAINLSTCPPGARVPFASFSSLGLRSFCIRPLFYL